MTDLISLAQPRDALRKRELSATELAEAYIAAAERARVLNAFVLETPDRARALAASLRCPPPSRPISGVRRRGAPGQTQQAAGRLAPAKMVVGFRS